MKSFDECQDRVNHLKSTHSQDDRRRIRSVMNGGAEGVKAILANSKSEHLDLGVDLPTANVMYSGLERLAQRIGRAPTLKTDMVPIQDNQTARSAADKRARIVGGWDEMDRMELQFPQIGRWLPGYGFTVHIIRERQFGPTTYPVAELRDPYDVYPGFWGPSQQPQEVAILRNVARSELKRIYPEFTEVMNNRWANKSSFSVPILDDLGAWEGNPAQPVMIAEYIDADATYVLCPELGKMLSVIPNPLESGPAFVMTKRTSFDRIQSHYHHAFGLMAMMGKLNMLGLIAAEDSTFRETNIIGELIGDEYERGRKGINYFEMGTTIEKPTSDQLAQTWQAINILERQFRIVSGYPVSDDGQSPNSFATGAGISELRAGANDNIKEYQTAIRHSMELIDRKRLEWEEKMHATERKRVFWYEGGNRFEETYVPAKDIASDYRTKRVYGAMATFDENSKIVAGLQLLQARVFDRRTLQENIDGMEAGELGLVNERIDQDDVKQMLFQALSQRAAAQDPAAAEALVRILKTPGDVEKILEEFIAPPEAPSLSGMLGGGGGGPPGMLEGGAGGAPPAVQTILAQMEAEGGGAQTVGQL